MRLKYYFGKSSTNYHGTQAKGESWNNETVYGWKIISLDIKPLGETRAKWYKRFILYFPSGAWWYFDMVIVCQH